MRGDFKRLKRETESGKSETVVIANSLAQRPVRFGFIHAAILLAVVIFLVTTFFWLRQPLPAPRVLSTTQLTHDNLAKSALVTDGPRLYFNESLGEKSILSQVSTTGGDIAQIPTPFKNANLHDVAPSRSPLLVDSFSGEGGIISTDHGPFLYLPDRPAALAISTPQTLSGPLVLCRRPRWLSRKMGRYRTAQVSNLYGIPFGIRGSRPMVPACASAYSLQILLVRPRYGKSVSTGENYTLSFRRVFTNCGRVLRNMDP